MSIIKVLGRISGSLIVLLFTASALSQEVRQDPRAQVFSDGFPYESKFIQINAQQMHYIDKGEGQIFLFLHGNPTSSYLWRNVMPYCRAGRTSCGRGQYWFRKKSAQPQLDYTYQTHYQFISQFIEKLGLENIILVVHDWGSVIGLDYARQNEKNVAGVVFMEAIIPPSFPMAGPPGGPDGLFAKFRNLETGKDLLITQNLFVEQLLIKGTLTRNLTEVEANAYRAPFVNPENVSRSMFGPMNCPLLETISQCQSN